MMNANTTAAIAAIQEILATVTTTATTAITAINEILATVTTTETATTETTTTEAATTETATTPEEKAIVVLDEDDNVIAVGATTGTETTTEATTTGSLPCPTADTTATVEEATTTTTAETTETATATVEEATTTTTAEVVETTSNGVTTARKTVIATEDDLENIYEIIKYVLRHEGVNCDTDTSIYAPTKNVHVSFNNNRYKMYLSIHDSELVVMLMKCNCNEKVIMKMKATISSIEIVTVDEEIEVLASNARINTVINLMSSAIDLIK